MIEPLLRDEALLEDIAIANTGNIANAGNDEFRLWWLAQNGFLLQWRGRHLLMDPYFSDSLARKYAGAPIPHLRMTAIPVKPELLDFIDVVSASRIHTDHLDRDTLHELFKVNLGLKFVIPEAERDAIAKKLSATWTDVRAQPAWQCRDRWIPDQRRGIAGAANRRTHSHPVPLRNIRV